MKDDEISIKSLKHKSRKVLKSHYWLLIVICLFAAFLGAEFTDALLLTEMEVSFFSDIVKIPSAIIDGGKDIIGDGSGLLASMLNTIGSGTIIASAFSAINSIIGSELIAGIIVISLVLAGVFAFWFLTGNMFKVISRRIFLESRIYKKTNSQRILFLYHVKKWINVSWVMLVTLFFNLCWYLVFFVGGVVKKYSYFLVPYILAENPSVKAKEAICLSRKMMVGYKWQAFKLELSFIGWWILRVFTLGLSGLFYSNAYQVATHSEFYVYLRNESKKNNIEGIDILNDKYLYELPSKEVVDKEYSDVVEILNKPKVNYSKSKIETVLNYIGITLKRDLEDEVEEKAMIEENQAKLFEEVLEIKRYPMRLCVLPERVNHSRLENVNYMMRYSIQFIILFFFIFSFIGWIYEVSIHIVRDGEFVNRGTMFGPWLPIYGSGGILILTLLYKFRRSALLQFFAAVILCGFVEYFAGFALEYFNDGMKWWDYSGYFLNIHGRVCAEALIIFGLGGIAVVYLIAPILSSYFSSVKVKVLNTIVLILISLFVVDLVYSSVNPNVGEGITTALILK